MSSNELEKSDLKFYLTSLEPNMDQSIYSQSLGGYISNSLVYVETFLTETVGLYDTTIYVNDSLGYSSWDDVKYVSINSEMMGFRGSDGNSSVVSRAANNILGVHIVSDEVRGVSEQFFNNVTNDNFTQYRCIAVKNTNPWFTAYNISAYISQNSINSKTSIKIALERPLYQRRIGTSSEWTNISLTDISLANIRPNDYYKEAYLRITGGPNTGQNRLVSSFDSNTGQFVFYDSLPVNYNSSYSSQISYEIDPAPAQRIISGIVAPESGGSRVSSFLYASSPTYSISLDDSGPGSDNLAPDDIFYIWIERELTKGSNLFEGNSVILGLEYSNS